MKFLILALVPFSLFAATLPVMKSSVLEKVYVPKTQAEIDTLTDEELDAYKKYGLLPASTKKTVIKKEKKAKNESKTEKIKVVNNQEKTADNKEKVAEKEPQKIETGAKIEAKKEVKQTTPKTENKKTEKPENKPAKIETIKPNTATPSAPIATQAENAEPLGAEIEALEKKQQATNEKLKKMAKNVSEVAKITTIIP